MSHGVVVREVCVCMCEWVWVWVCACACMYVGAYTSVSSVLCIVLVKWLFSLTSTQPLHNDSIPQRHGTTQKGQLLRLGLSSPPASKGEGLYF